MRPFKFDDQSTDRSGKCSGVLRKRIFLPCYLLWLTQGSIRHAKFHFDRFKASLLQGEKLKNRPVSKNNTALHLAQC